MGRLSFPTSYHQGEQCQDTSPGVLSPGVVSYQEEVNEVSTPTSHASLPQLVLDALENKLHELSIQVIAERIGKRPDSVKRTLSRMVERGELQRVSHGKYSLIDNPVPFE